MPCEILLEFHGKNPELTKTLFRENTGTVQIAVRGKTPGAHKDAGTFQWSSAVRALSLLLTKAALLGRGERHESNAGLRGYAGSVAASLDYAISKEPSWIIEMFGIEKSGRSRIRKLIKRTNAERKLPGPVMLVLNTAHLPLSAITIWWNGARVVDPTVLKSLIHLLELQSGSTAVESPLFESPEEFFVRKAKAA